MTFFIIALLAVLYVGIVCSVQDYDVLDYRAVRVLYVGFAFCSHVESACMTASFQ